MTRSTRRAVAAARGLRRQPIEAAQSAAGFHKAPELAACQHKSRIDYVVLCAGREMGDRGVSDLCDTVYGVAALADQLFQIVLDAGGIGRRACGLAGALARLSSELVDALGTLPDSDVEDAIARLVDAAYGHTPSR